MKLGSAAGAARFVRTSVYDRSDSAPRAERPHTMVDPSRIVFRSDDPVQIELAEAHLRAAGIPFVRVGRGNAALLGAGSTVVAQQLEVDAADEAEALGLLAGTHSPAADASDGVRDGQVEPAPRRRLAFVAAGLALLWPGLAVSYAGLYVPGLLLAVWPFASMAQSGAGMNGVSFVLFGCVLPRLLDLAVSQPWLRRWGRDGASLGRQLGVGAALALGCTLLQQRLDPPLQEWLANAERARTAGAWPFDQTPDSAALSDTGVLEEQLPVLAVIHFGDDDSWAFLSRLDAPQDSLQVISMEQALRLDDTVRELGDLAPGWTATRAAVGAPWRREAEQDSAGDVILLDTAEDDRVLR